jgi:SAM-dependent methyltransferase
MSRTDKTILPLLEDELWVLTRRICAAIELIEQDPVHAGELEVFRREVFVPKVLRWYRMNDELDRIWNKPAGYSGDYHTIELLCQNDTSLEDFDDIFLQHVLRCDMASQHRSKVLAHTEFLLRVLEQGVGRSIRILNIGCGPSYDVRQAISRLQNDSCGEVILADLDAEALSFSKVKLKENDRGLVFTYVAGDVIEVIRRFNRREDLGSFDAVLFGGLFDYIPDRIISLVLKKSRSLLAPGGEIMFSQVSRDNPDRVFMKWFGDWELIERDESQLRDLCLRTGFQETHIRMKREHTNCAIICRLSSQPAWRE